VVGVIKLIWLWLRSNEILLKLESDIQKEFCYISDNVHLEFWLNSQALSNRIPFILNVVNVGFSFISDQKKTQYECLLGSIYLDMWRNKI
jgi:hypothetical protein